MRPLRFIFAALLTLGLCACVVLKTPVGSSVGYVNDPALEGLWFGTSDGKNGPSRSAYYHVILNDDHTITVVGVAPRTATEKADWGTIILTTVKLGPNHYVNVRDIREHGQAAAPGSNSQGLDALPQSISLYYTVEGDTLTLFMFNPDAVGKAVKAHRIAGEVGGKKGGNEGDNAPDLGIVTITADAAHLDKFLSAPDAPKLFTEVIKLKRIR